MRTCKNCQKPFEPKSHRSVHCSIECRTNFFREQARQKHAERMAAERSAQPVICQQCGREFETVYCNSNRTKFCSSGCKDEWHKAKKREANKQKHKTNPLECEFCKQEFVPYREDQRFCSNKCKTDQNAAEQRRAREEERKRTVKVCPICEKEFNPKRSMREIYCSSRCRNLFPKRIYGALSRCYKCTGQEKLDHSHKLLGYSPRQLQEHIQSHPNWEKVKNGEWHLDHVFPIIAFLEHGIKEISLMCALDNLQPLSGKKNCQKNGRYDRGTFEKWLHDRGIKNLLRTKTG